MVVTVTTNSPLSKTSFWGEIALVRRAPLLLCSDRISYGPTRFHGPRYTYVPVSNRHIVHACSVAAGWVLGPEALEAATRGVQI